MYITLIENSKVLGYDSGTLSNGLERVLKTYLIGIEVLKISIHPLDWYELISKGAREEISSLRVAMKTSCASSLLPLNI